jgi:hypothetical protein
MSETRLACLACVRIRKRVFIVFSAAVKAGVILLNRNLK